MSNNQSELVQKLANLADKWRADPSVASIGGVDLKMSYYGLALEDCADELEATIKPHETE